MKTGLFSLAVMASSAAAHTIMQEIYVNGVSQGHLKGVRVVDYDGVCFLPFCLYEWKALMGIGL